MLCKGIDIIVRFMACILIIQMPLCKRVLVYIGKTGIVKLWQNLIRGILVKKAGKGV